MQWLGVGVEGASDKFTRLFLTHHIGGRKVPVVKRSIPTPDAAIVPGAAARSLYVAAISSGATDIDCDLLSARTAAAMLATELAFDVDRFRTDDGFLNLVATLEWTKDDEAYGYLPVRVRVGGRKLTVTGRASRSLRPSAASS